MGEAGMSEVAGNQEPPTYFANIVSLQVTVDETVLEFRRYLLPHKEQLKLSPAGPVIPIPEPTPEQLLAAEPIARVVLTYTAAQALRQNLNNMLPGVEMARKTGEKPWK